MARPIEPTPVLTGKAACTFLKRLDNKTPNKRLTVNVSEIAKRVSCIYENSKRQK